MLNKKVLLAIPALIGLIVAGSGFISSFPGYPFYPFFTFEERLVFDDKIIHDHSLDSPKAIAYQRIIESENLSFRDRLILNSIDKHDLSTAKTILFTQMTDDDEVALKKKVIFNAIHEFDSHNFHDFCHKSHDLTGVKVSVICE